MASRTNRHPSAPPVALVTGAADRLGAAIALALAADGFKTLIHYRASADKAETLAASIRAAGGEAATVRADLTVRRQRAALIEKAGKPFGPLTVLVNNASLFEPDQVADLDEALWDRHFAIHAEAPTFLARDFAAQLPAKVQGNIVNIIDERVLHPTPNYFSYTLSKAALRDATVTMAQSLAPRIRVNAVGPGPTLPHRGQSEAAFRRSQARAPLGYGATPAEIAEAVLFLIHARAITGQFISVDGGRHVEFEPQRGPTPRKP